MPGVSDTLDTIVKSYGNKSMRKEILQANLAVKNHQTRLKGNRKKNS